MALEVRFVDLILSKLSQVLETHRGEPKRARGTLNPNLPTGMLGNPCWGEARTPGTPSPPCNYLLGQGPPVIITLMLGFVPLLSPGPMRRFIPFTS